MLALGTIFCMIGFGMFGIVSAYWLFVLAVVIITVGEMIGPAAAGVIIDNYNSDLLWYLGAVLCALSADAEHG